MFAPPPATPLTLALPNHLFLFFIYLKLELLTQFPASTRHLGIKGSYLPLYKVADKTLWYQGDEILRPLGYKRVYLCDTPFNSEVAKYKWLWNIKICKIELFD